MTSPLVVLLGEVLLNKQREKVDPSSLAADGRVIGLYFSAHWCAPCREYTPILSNFYNSFNSEGNGGGGKRLEIVFVSSDKTEQHCDEHFMQHMPWLLLPFSERHIKNKLCKRFKVTGIPTLVLINSVSAQLITNNGRLQMLDDLKGEHFPWYPKPFNEVIAGKLLKQGDEVQAEKELKGKIVGIYFSAHWCPPCKAFTRVLTDMYRRLQASKMEFEFVFCSTDRTKDAFESYYSNMPWLALPYNDPRCNELSKMFTISGIPSLVLLDETGKVITLEGRAMTAQDPEGLDFPWYPTPLLELDDSATAAINEEACLILFADIEGDDDVIEAKDLLLPIAREYTEKAEATGKDCSLRFFIGGDEEMVDNLREFLRIDEDSLPLLLILDIPEQRMVRCQEREITREIARDFIEKYLANQLKFETLEGL
ncbi:nucleoredoxin-like [Patiria miniata]|uniref:Thioredoxin domain-containing protein n=1 Tax=Patiria miniata TaxID=46514 RepID=A0A914ADZ7_PATMI|nr:nucleoredoxin-like [Patiria miniata]